MAEEIEERRRYFRVNDTIHLFYRMIEEQTPEGASHVSNDVLNNCSLASALEMLDREAKYLLPRLERRDPELFEYLKVMDTKISLIAEAVSSHYQQFDEHDTRNVVMSATGLAFENGEPIPNGQLLELRMLLASCMVVIVAYCRVVQCRETGVIRSNGRKHFTICVEYLNLTDDDRELLIKHVVKKQLQQLRDKYE